VFHGEASDKARKRRLLEAVEEPVPATNRFLGATFGAVDLDYEQLDGPTNTPIDCRGASFESISLRFGTVDHPLDLRGSTVTGQTTFDETRFARRVDLGHARFASVSMRLTKFESWLDARETTFGEVCGRVAWFANGIYSVDARFTGAADFTNAQFEDVANFYRVEFDKGAWFKRTDFADKARFKECTLAGPAVEFGSVAGNPKHDRPAANGAAGMLLGVDCDGPLLFDGATLAGGLRIDNASLSAGVSCVDFTVQDEPVTIDLTGTERVTGTVAATDGNVEYKLTQAVLGDLILAEGTAFETLIFDETVFDGFDFTRYRKQLAAVEYTIHNPDDPPSVRETTYVRARNGAEQVGDNRAVAEFFFYEMIARRGSHRREFTQSDGLARLRHAGRYLGNVVMGLSCGYGERPLWTVLSSVGIIVAFTLVYAAANIPLSIGQSILSYLTFSVQSFVSLVLGGPTVENTFISFIGAVEGFLGGFMIALFVFTLTRSIAR
jgi:uncharacterized protein YjbI with pentapeptide repeats